MRPVRIYPIKRRNSQCFSLGSRTTDGPSCANRKLKEDGYFEVDTQYVGHHLEKINDACEGHSPHVGTLFRKSSRRCLAARRDND